MSIQAKAAIFDFRKTTSRENLLVWKHTLGSKKIVFTNGVFDILHRGHVEYLAKASALGDILVVGLNTDQSVHRLKGPNRPIHSEEDRATVLSMLKGIDAVVYFDEDTPFELISFLVPTVLTKGADYKVEDIVGANVVIANGGDVVTIDLTEGRSTTNAIETIIQRYEKR